MRFVELVDGAFEVRWTWLPFWLATNPKLKTTLEGELKSIVALAGITASEADLDLMHAHVVRRLQELFPQMSGLREFLDGLRKVELA